MQDNPVNKWTEELLQKGSMRGRLEGFKVGYIKGFKAGFFQARREVARNMVTEGKTISFISALTGIKEQDIKRMNIETAQDDN